MNLRNRKIKGKAFSHELSAPERISDSDLKDAVQKLRAGDDSVKESLITGHLGLAMSIVARYNRYVPNYEDEMVGVAFLAVAQAVNKFREVAKDDNITGYIVSKIHNRISRYLEKRHLIPIPPRTLKRHPEYQIPSVFSLTEPNKDGEEFNVTSNTDEEFIRKKTDHKFERDVIDPHNYLEYQELLEQIQNATETIDEELVVKYRAEGWTDDQIAGFIDKTGMRVNQLRNKVRRKFNEAAMA